MGTVTALPEGTDKSWRLVAPGFRKLLIQQGVSPKCIDIILTEMEGYHHKIEAPLWFDIPLLRLTDEQAAIFNRAFGELSEEIRERIYTAHGIILNLLIEKYR